MTLTPEQQAALDQLFVHVPTDVASTDSQPVENDALKTWLGISGSELKAKLPTLFDKKNVFEQQLLSLVEANPLDAAVTFLAASSAAICLIRQLKSSSSPLSSSGSALRNSARRHHSRM